MGHAHDHPAFVKYGNPSFSIAFLLGFRQSAHRLSTGPERTDLDQGLPGDSVGDVRIFHFEGETEDGSPVVTEWIMTTTGLNTAQPGAESRVTLGVFSFEGFDQDQILLEGVGLYPSADNTFLPSSELVRAIIGGTGRFKGATGEVTSIHLDDGSWMHVFDFGPRRSGPSRD